VAQSTDKEAEERRAYRHELRLVARLLRWTGMVLVVLGTVGIALGRGGAWFTAPSWISFVIGWALALSGLVRRENRATAVDPGD
jgi:hypothetical protein